MSIWVVLAILLVTLIAVLRRFMRNESASSVCAHCGAPLLNDWSVRCPSCGENL